MSSQLSNEQWVKEELDRFRKDLPEGPDLTVNKSIVTFTSLSFLQHLSQHYETRKMEAGDHAADYMKSLASSLAVLTPGPALAGLGALTLAIIIDMDFRVTKESIKDALRSVFADEKAWGVWNQIGEFLKRCVIHLHDDYVMTGDLRYIGDKLSLVLTKLKNSMVSDMSFSALKAWVNGAAFHVQMLIQLVRLRGIETCDPVESLLSTYQRDLETLFTKHKELIQEKCYFDQAGFVDEDSKSYVIVVTPFGPSEKEYREIYYDKRYSGQKAEIQQHFMDVSQNLQELVQQAGAFIVQ